MLCEKCMNKMEWSVEGNTQGWKCPVCGWGIITTFIDTIYYDKIVYSLYIKNVVEIDVKMIKAIAKIANVNFITAKKILEEGDKCIMKARALETKQAIEKLQELDVEYVISPTFEYLK